LGENATHRCACAAIGLSLLLAACNDEAAPLPSADAAATPAPTALPAARAQLAANASPAPGVEISKPTDRLLEPAAHLVFDIAIGRHASEFVAKTIERDFEASHPDLDYVSRQVPDRDAVELMLVGRVDAALVACTVTQRDIRAGLRPTRIGAEIFVLAVPAGFAVPSLTRAQVCQLLTGQAGDWRAFGGPALPVSIVTVDGRGFAERASRAMAPGDRLVQACLRLRTDAEVLAHVRDRVGTVGLVRLAATEGVPGVRLIPVDTVEPSAEAYAREFYPFGDTLSLVTNGDAGGHAAALRDLLLGDGDKTLFRVLTPLP
jgi:hypothetical protein